MNLAASSVADVVSLASTSVVVLAAEAAKLPPLAPDPAVLPLDRAARLLPIVVATNF